MNELASYNFSRVTQPDTSSPELVEAFMDAAVQLGAEFLSCGGPVTRLEAQLSTAGLRSGYDTTVHATPSAITIYCHIRNDQESYSRGGRMQSFGVDLGRLSLVDEILSGFALSEIRSDQVLCRLREMRERTRVPHPAVHFLSVLGIGAGAALLSGANFTQSIVCGLFSVMIQIFVVIAGRVLSLSPTFAEFLACFLAFLFAALSNGFMQIPPQFLALGTLIYVVPGLLMTTAISELVDQNYLSGSIRLLKALCTFMAMALAYFLAADLGRALAFNVQDVSIGISHAPAFLARMIGSAIIILCSAFEFRAHMKSMIGILACGLSGAASYIVTESVGNLVAPHFLAAFVIGLISYQLSRRYNHPSQIYSVPSVLILAPGMLAFSSFGYGAHDDFNLPSIVRATLISLSIVFGLAASRLTFRGKKAPEPASAAS